MSGIGNRQNEMTRRKSVCTKWTLVILLVVLSSIVSSRPQDSSQEPIITNLGADNELRYRHSNVTISNKLPRVISINSNISGSLNAYNIADTNINYYNRTNVTDLVNSNTETKLKIKNTTRFGSDALNSNYNNIALIEILGKLLQRPTNRTGRIITTKTKNQKLKSKTRSRNNKPKVLSNDFESKSSIRKVISKWTDQTKDLIPETTTSSKNHDKINFVSFDDKFNVKKESKKQHNNVNRKKFNKPKPQSSNENKVYSNHVHILEYPFPNHNSYFHTTQPTPTPIITNVGYPKPWFQNKKPTPKPKPIQDYTYNHPNYEVTTFPPSNGYTEKIIIRPDEYSGAADDCPTIYLTLNNTFQGQAKETCPDLNIAVNTNVINKNVIVESEEDTPDGNFPDFFGLPFGDDLTTDDSSNNEYLDSDETPEQESASVESESLNYNAANAIQSESNEVGGYGSPSQISSAAIAKPHRPSIHKDDDFFSFTSMLDFFRPAVNVLGWLTSINPLSIGIIPLLLTPLAFLFAGSGIAALFSPWFLPLGREAPKVVQVYKPHSYWDDTAKSWHSNAFPPNRKWQNEARDSKELLIDSIKPAILSNLKDLITQLKQKVNQKELYKESNTFIRKNRRRKREIWSFRVK